MYTKNFSLQNIYNFCLIGLLSIAPVLLLGQNCTDSITRTVSSVTHCSNNHTVGVYTNSGIQEWYPISNGQLIEYSDGSARLTGDIELGDVNIEFSGRMEISFPHPPTCDYEYEIEDWYRYTTFEGSIGNLTVWPVEGDNSKFQVGTGASLHHTGYGAAGWFKWSNPQGGHGNGEFFLEVSEYPGLDCMEDSDGDEVCNCEDCDTDNPNYPMVPGTPCDDGNPDTHYEVIQADGCTCAEESECTPTELVHWSQDACSSGNPYDSDQTINNENSSYTEFTPSIIDNHQCLLLNASGIYRNAGRHSCTDGVQNKASCFGMPNIDNFIPDHDMAIRFEVNINHEKQGRLSQLKFYEISPGTRPVIITQKNWFGIIVNAYKQTISAKKPQFFTLRVLKNGVEIFSEERPASDQWTLQTFDFSENPAFEIAENTTFQFELLAYDHTGNGDMAVWDIDEISIDGCCTLDPCIGLNGDSDGDGVCDDNDCEPNNPNLPSIPGMTCDDGNDQTVYDHIQGDGCSCQGTPKPCDGKN